MQEELDRKIRERVKASERKGTSTNAATVRFESRAHGVCDRQLQVLWAARDNGADIFGWLGEAGAGTTSYCAGFGAGWTLPSVAEFESLYDKSSAFAKKFGYSTINPATDRISFTGVWYWSSENDGSAKSWTVSLADGSRYLNSDTQDLSKRALCIRRT